MYIGFKISRNESYILEDLQAVTGYYWQITPNYLPCSGCI